MEVKFDVSMRPILVVVETLLGGLVVLATIVGLSLFIAFCAFPLIFLIVYSPDHPWDSNFFIALVVWAVLMSAAFGIMSRVTAMKNPGEVAINEK